MTALPWHPSSPSSSSSTLFPKPHRCYHQESAYDAGFRPQEIPCPSIMAQLDSEQNGDWPLRSLKGLIMQQRLKIVSCLDDIVDSIR